MKAVRNKTHCPKIRFKRNNVYMENQVLLDNDIREFYQSWFNSLSKHIHYMDYRFTLLEDRLLKLEDRFNNLNKNTSTNG